jgi:hypothetical protein
MTDEGFRAWLRDEVAGGRVTASQMGYVANEPRVASDIHVP